MQVEHELGRPNRFKTLDQNVGHDDSRRKAFWRELQAMIRLRSPHTVHVYGAIRSRRDRLVLVMELLPGGDLRALLKDAAKPLAEEHARRIIGDV